MLITFDTRYLQILDGDIKASMMLAIAVYKQIEFDKVHESDRFGKNFWSMGLDEWRNLGLGTDKSQKNLKDKLSKHDFWFERTWGRACMTDEACPPHTQYFVDMQKLELLLDDA